MSINVTLINDVYHITLIRDTNEEKLSLLSKDILLTRSDDTEHNYGHDEYGYYYYIVARIAPDSEHISIPLEPTEADSILRQILVITGKYICDY